MVGRPSDSPFSGPILLFLTLTEPLLLLPYRSRRLAGAAWVPVAAVPLGLGLAMLQLTEDGSSAKARADRQPGEASGGLIHRRGVCMTDFGP